MGWRVVIWFLPLALAACGGAASDTGLEAAVRVAGGQFYRGSIDKLAGADAPAVVGRAEQSEHDRTRSCKQANLWPP